MYSQLALTYSMINSDAANPATRVPDTLSRKFGGRSKIAMSVNTLRRKSCRHIDMRLYFYRELSIAGVMKLISLHTHLMVPMPFSFYAKVVNYRFIITQVFAPLASSGESD